VAEASEAIAVAEASEAVAEAEASEAVAIAEASEAVAVAEASEAVAIAEASEAAAVRVTAEAAAESVTTEAVSEARADMIIESAWAGETVVVVVEAPLFWFGRNIEDIEPGMDGSWTKAMSGPATIALLDLSTAPPFNGWPSDVIQIATGPLIPCGTTHWSIGSGREKGTPPMSIWQK